MKANTVSERVFVLIQGFSFTCRDSLSVRYTLENISLPSSFIYKDLPLIRIFPANNCLRIESTYHRAVRILSRKVSYRSADLLPFANLLGTLTYGNVVKLLPSNVLFFSLHSSLSRNDKYKKLCTQVHFRLHSYVN